MQCTATAKSGLRCKFAVLNGRDVCFQHAPELRKERQAAQSRGGRARRGSLTVLPTEPFDLGDPAKISALLTTAANLLRAGQLDAKCVHALGHLADCALKAYVLSTQKPQLDRIERLLEAQPNRTANPAEAEVMLRFAPEEEFEIAARRRLQDKAHDEADGEPSLTDDDFDPDPIGAGE